MVTRVFGKVDGTAVIYDHTEGDRWEVPVPFDDDGEYIVEIIADDDAGNQTFLVRMLYTVDAGTVCICILPLTGYLFERQRRLCEYCGCRRGENAMLRFILGEDRHVRYFVHTEKNERFVIKEAAFSLIYDGKVEECGDCEITREENGNYLDIKLQPERRSRRYEIEVTICVADEIIKHRERMEVI